MIVFAAMLLWPGLYEQAVSRVLAQRFPAAEYLLIETSSGQTIAGNWPDPSQPVPVGSLTKPLLAARSIDRMRTCRPGECWLARGHGSLNLADAIASSCNAWFLKEDAGAATLIGLSGDWRISPTALAQEYIRLITEHAVVREGMRKAVEYGTAHRLGMSALAKTGTAACSHAKRGPGDGLVVVLWPEEKPKYLLMVRRHGTTGAVTAETAGALLRVVRDGR